MPGDLLHFLSAVCSWKWASRVLVPKSLVELLELPPKTALIGYGSKDQSLGGVASHRVQIGIHSVEIVRKPVG